MDENVRFRLQQLEMGMIDMHDAAQTDRETTLAYRQALHEEIILLRSDMAELLALFKGTKSTVLFAKGLGKITIGLSLFGGAIASLFFMIKAFALFLLKVAGR